MQGKADLSTLDVAATTLKIHSHVRFVPQASGSELLYHVENQETGEYYRIGHSEYAFLSILDGSCSFSQAVTISSRALGSRSLTQQAALRLYLWALEKNLGAISGQPSCGSLNLHRSIHPQGQSKAGLSLWNPFWIRIPLGKPQNLLTLLQPWFGWVFSVPSMLSALIPAGIALSILNNNRERLSFAAEKVFSGDNWYWLLLAWIALKLIHEFSHGIVCHRYGGTVRQMGIVLAIFTPMAYVDASACWAFRSRWQRIHTSVAGIYSELLIASFAAILWHYTQDETLSHILYNVIIMAGVSTVVFNLNPLMKFDGYYVLSDVMNIPNLSTQGTQAVQSVSGRLLLGFSVLPTRPGRKSWFLLAYGSAAILWRVLVCVTLILTASVLYHGAGIVLAITGIVVWFWRPLAGAWSAVQRMQDEGSLRILRAGTVLFTGFSAFTAVLTLLPAPVLTQAPGIVEYTDGEIIRPRVSGFVRSVFVSNGQFVKAGDILLQLQNDEVVNESRDLLYAIRQEELRLQTARREHKSSAISIAESTLKSLQRRQLETQKNLSSLDIKASRDGTVIGRDLEQLRGRFVEQGDPLMTVGSESRKEVRISIRQQDLPVASTQVGNMLNVRVGTRSSLKGIFSRINPGASRDLPHPAMAASAGGPLTIIDDPGDEVRDSGMILAEHRFQGVIQLDESDSLKVFCGERAQAGLGHPQISLGRYLYRAGRHWVEETLRIAVHG
ncbi:MAG: efflux RND transporter periplasmic adaptor subunit [Planctomyces sp.]|nr:efflux RND transporter periplasmic adaptor subunit [Planctomyces sp.]